MVRCWWVLKAANEHHTCVMDSMLGAVCYIRQGDGSVCTGHAYTKTFSFSLSLSRELFLSRHWLSFLLVAPRSRVACTANVAKLWACIATTVTLCWLHATQCAPTYISGARGMTGERAPERHELCATLLHLCIAQAVYTGRVQPIAAKGGWHGLHAL